MTPEYNVGHFVWSKKYGERVTIARISIDTNGITYIDLGGNHHKPTDLSAEFTREQFDKVVEELWHFPKEIYLDNDAVWEVVQECIKEVQE